MTFALVFLACSRLLASLASVDGTSSVMGQAVALLDPDTEVVFLGTSHVLWAVDPRLYTQRTVNVAGNSLDYACMERIADGVLRRATGLKVLVIEADIYPLRADSIALYDRDLSILHDLGLSLWAMPRAWWWKVGRYPVEGACFRPIFYGPRLTPAYGLVVRPKVRAAEVVPGHFTMDDVMDVERSASVAKHRRDLRPDHSHRNLPALLRLVQQARRRGIRVVLVRLPHHASYWAGIPGAWESQVQAMIQAVRSVDADVAWYDFGREARFATEEFHDADHLNADGVQELAPLLRSVLREAVADSGR